MPTTTQGIEGLRTERGLRALESKEDGFDIQHLPNGIFGFTYSAGQKEMPVFGKKPVRCFELHKLKDGSVHLIGFVKAETKAKIDAHEATVEAMIYPDVFQDSTELISVDLEKMQPAKKALTREDGNPFKTLVYGN